MDITGTHSIPGPRDRVFASLCDPAVLMRCIPVLEEMERLSPTDYTARVRATVGPLKARFSGKLKLEPQDGAHRYRLVAQGNGGLAGAVKGEALVVLEESGDGHTLLNYSLSVALGGAVGRLAVKLVQAKTDRVLAAFFERFTAELADGP
ncbi:CoxG family protein [Azospirillum picis]|uniref:Carbon monoxide dehydrogenase subunit G n=1 Tax=Azospirillum picis TaxID=488438 RepID=A0ABU0ME89_9PROT|nr:carbon monoxide dehydrogenase subunit G [Azospirillum picis]MBP2297908.1 carbon monoxide dehydrogenase subunit G [Azospirillum picis]MDQ0531746.1 carbon monoxide dehydrogenase subunit G [Azospirillum picis]